MNAQDGILSTQDRLIYMANQIALNLEAEGPKAVKMIAEHLRSFWDPLMRQRIVALAHERPNAFSPAAAAAVALLAVA